MMMGHTKRCMAKQHATANYTNYYPARGGHVVDVSDWSAWELDEIDAGSQTVSANCVNCGEYIFIALANDLEHGGDSSPYVPSKDLWNELNGLKG